MFKYLKWISLILLISCIIYVLYLYIGYFGEKLSDGSSMSVDSLIQQVYDIKWTRSGLTIYKDGEIIVDNKNSVDVNYMIFSSKNVQYCNHISGECEKYNYSYRDGKITFEDFVLPDGTYDVYVDEEGLHLSISNETTKVIYYYDSPKG